MMNQCHLISTLPTRAFSAFSPISSDVCSLMSDEKQMPASQSLVFLLWTLYHNTDTRHQHRKDQNMNFKTEILKSIQIMIDRKLACYRADHTFKTAVRKTTPKGYVITDEAGNERTVKCAVPGVTLAPGQFVWATMPCGRLNDLHISGVV